MKLEPPQNKSDFPQDDHASGRFLAAVGGTDEAELVHFRALVASESYAIAALDLDQTIVSWSRGGEALFGYAASEIVGRNFALLLTGVDEALAQLKPRVSLGETVELDTRLRRADGKVVQSFVTATPVHSPDGSVIGTALIMRDVGQANEMERRLREASEVEAIGRAAASIAHDINNVLAVVQAYGEFVAEGPLTPAQEVDLRMSRDAARRGAELTGQLLGLSRQRLDEAEEVELNDVLRGSEAPLRRLLGKGIELVTTPSTSSLKVRAVPALIERIMLNLALNGRDAMPTGGKLEISLKKESAPAPPAPADAWSGPCAVLVVHDTGVGMNAETRAKIFAPFFTTKVGERSGLGLLVVREAVRELGGIVSVDSAPDQGTTFTVRLPLVRAQQVQSPLVVDASSGVATLLVVESDAGLRAAISRILRRAGYATLEAASNEAGAALVREQGERIRAIVSDLATAAGAPTALDAREWPQIRRIYLSGNPTALVEAGAAVVAKPFAEADLLGAVAKTLARRLDQTSVPVSRSPVALIVDPDEQLAESLARLLQESDLEVHTTPTGLHALQLLKKLPVDVLITDQLMPGIEGTRLLELAATSCPQTARILFTADASPEVVLNAVNRGRVSKVLLKSMHPVAIRDEIAAVANETLRRKVRNSLSGA